MGSIQSLHTPRIQVLIFSVKIKLGFQFKAERLLRVRGF
ncbi:MAG: hypothetical protein ACI88H_000629 [Cocleimonas sp.]|jgi:hypothetical protein